MDVQSVREYIVENMGFVVMSMGSEAMPRGLKNIEEGLERAVKDYPSAVLSYCVSPMAVFSNGDFRVSVNVQYGDGKVIDYQWNVIHHAIEFTEIEI